jgi:hypothetical protein
MTDVQGLFASAELALASYASLHGNTQTSDAANFSALKDAGFSAKQAEEFAKKYPTVVTQYNDTGTSFSATVFKDTSGNLTLAIRGTLELTGTPNDLTTDGDIALAGAGHDQIVAMVNWWLRASTPASETVLQYKIVPGPLDPHDGIQFGTRWLQILSPVAGTGELVNAIGADADHKLDVTGHSLGGHLAMAFGALFPSATSQVTAFNAPGFSASAVNQTFFSALGGSVPSGVATTNVVADEAQVGGAPWNAIAALHGRPGTPLNIAIENQFQSDEPNPAGALNHSQQSLTDALAVFAVLAKLDPALSAGTFKSILGSAVVGTSASLERIVDALERIFTSDSSNMATGNANRDTLYQSIYGVQDNGTFQALSGSASIVPLSGQDAGSLAAQAKSDFGTFLALDYLLPFAIQDSGGVLTGTHADLYAAWQADQALSTEQKAAGAANYSEDWHANRAKMLTWLLQANENDRTTIDSGQKLDGAWLFEDNATGKSVIVQPQGGIGGVEHKVLFGSDGNGFLAGLEQTDRLYGMGGDDTLRGMGGADRLEGGTGQDEIDGGDGNDILRNGAGSQTLHGEDGNEMKCRRWGDGILATWAGRNAKVGAGGTANDGTWQRAA